ncbi:DUF1801 domain-containing protein [Erythrobacter sp. SCSIO 43205]|uniref:DUF1801 domain-containing protein n=1 Tax=Erythrobacter sp. SCSIO 43205 TaxID=2779361 RepID=UPI001CA8F0EC|nr:DUF1801 domain-containing protein [Erythrobacter sp. SCSIO 43205]UAB77428.1 DUF1801 domain-containing protein [Erythrobacter sp. SCSIO 43205]
MAENKTKPTKVSVDAFIEAVEPQSKRDDARVLDALFRKVTGQEPQMWGPSIIGYGSYHYKYDSGREGDMCRTGFSPRKAKHSLYLMGRYCDEATGAKVDALLEQMGKHKTGASCVYVNNLADIDLDVLEEIVEECWEAMNRVYPE